MKTNESTKKNSDLLFYIGISTMILDLIGLFFIEPASILQKSLFFISAFILTVLAYLNNQKMFYILQIVITLGTVLAFFDFSNILNYITLLGTAVIGIWYLRSIQYYKTDAWGVVCTLGLLLIASGFATNAATHPFYFGLFLGVGALLAALYSFIDFFYRKNSVALIWFILNIAFAIKPLLMVFSL